MTHDSDTPDAVEHPGHATPRAIPEAGLMGRIVDRVSDVFSAGILLAAGILILEVFLRYVFTAPTIWGHETVVFLIATVFIFGGLAGASRDRHIRVVLIYDALPPRARRAFDVVISALCALSALFFTFATWVAMQRAIFAPSGEFRLQTTGTAFDAPYPGILRVVLFVVLLLLCLQFVILAVNYARGKR